MTVICFRMSFEVSNVELLFNDFIRSRQHVLRNRQSDLLRRLQIYHQLKLCRLLDWQIGAWHSSGFVHVIGDAPVAVREVRPVEHEPAGIYKFSVAVHRRQPAL